MNLLIMAGLTIANLLLLILVVAFWIRCNNRASKIGFGIMSTVYLLNIIVLAGGVI